MHKTAYKTDSTKNTTNNLEFKSAQKTEIKNHNTQNSQIQDCLAKNRLSQNNMNEGNPPLDTTPIERFISTQGYIDQITLAHQKNLLVSPGLYVPLSVCINVDLVFERTVRSLVSEMEKAPTEVIFS